MKYIISTFFIIISLSITAQICNVCPAGSSTVLQSTFPSSAAHQWTCTNGFNSTLVSPSFNPTENCTCYLQVDDGLCLAYDTLQIQVCNCNNSPCLGLAYNDATPSVTFTKTGTINSPIATDVVQYKREQQTAWTNVPVSNQLTGCDVKSYLNVTPYCTFSGGNFNMGYTASICPGVVMTGWQWRGNDGSAITGLSGLLTDWVSRTPTQLTSAGNGGVLDIFARVLNNPNRTITAKIRYTYTGSGTTCSSITSQVISNGIYNYDFEARRIVTYTNGCPPDTCYTQINLPTDNSCQTYGYLSRVNFGDGLCPTVTGGGALYMTVANAKAPVTYQWRYNGSNVAFNPPSYQQGGYCLDGRPFGEYCVTATDADGCTMQDCYVYQAICNTNVTISLSGTTLTASPVNCVGTPSYVWRRFVNGSWTQVGTGNSYNTGGVSGQYQVSLTCTGPPTCSAISEYEYINPCNVGVSVSVGTTTLTANVTGCGGSSISYTWQRWTGSSWVQVQTNTTTSTSNLHSPSVSGLYRILISCNGCNAQNQASITLPDPCQSFFAQMNGPGSVCTGQGGTFTRTVSGGTAPFTTQWFIDFTLVSNFSSFTWSPATPGTYTIQVRVIDANNCQYTDTRSVNVQGCCNLSNSISPSSISLCTNNTQNFSVSTFGGSGSVSTVWSSQLNGGALVFEGSGSSVNINKSTSGTYSIRAVSTDQGGCQSTSFATMTVNNCTVCNCNPAIFVNQNCSLGIGVSGTGCDGYSYQLQYSPSGSGWTSVASGASFTPFTYIPTANGQYRIVITKSGCPGATAETGVNCVVTQCTNNPTINLNTTSTTQCGLTPITITGTRGGSATTVTATKSVNAGGTLSPASSISSSFSFTYTPIAADYGQNIVITFTTDNPSGAPCQAATSTHAISLSNNPTPTITSSNSSLCVGQNRNLTANPAGGTFTVTSGPGQIIGNTLTSTGAGTININYSINQGGCSGSATQSITSVALPSTPTASVNCSGGFNNAVINVTAPLGGGLEYRLNNGAWQSSTSFGGLANGVYSIFVRNTNGCESSTTVNVNCGCANQPSIVIPANDNACGTQVKSITGSFTGATTVTVSLSANAGGTLSSTNINSSPFTITYTPVTADVGKTITITFTSNNPLGAPCVADVKNYNLTVLPTPTPSISGPTTYCTGNSVIWTASGGLTYSWSNGLGSGSTKSINTSGTYIVTVTAANGCSNTSSRTISENALPEVSITSSGNPVCLSQSRSLTASPSGGTWTLSGQGQITGSTFTANTTGSANITYTYTDANGCTNIASQNITINANPSTPSVSVDCGLGFGNGVITVTSPTGAGLEYRLNTGSWQSSNTFSSVTNGSYTVSVRNASGCESSTTTTVNCGCVNSPTLTLSSSTGTTCGTNAITVSVNTFGGSATQVTSSENGAGSLSVSTFNLSPFSFTYNPASGDIGNTVTITFTTNNPNGSPCQPATSTYILQVLPNPTAAISGPTSVCSGQSVNWTASGGNSYQWSNSLGTSATQSIALAGTYTVTVTAANECTSTASRTLTVNSLPVVSISSGSSNLCVGQTRTLTGSPSGGTWSITGQGQITGNTLTANTSGTANITYTYTDGNGCTNTANQSITIVSNPSTPSVSVDCGLGFGNGVINITSPTGAGLEYRLNTGSWQSGNTFSSVANGSYTVSVRNSSGCINSTTVNVNCGCANSPTLTLSGSNGSTCGTNPVTVSGNTFGGSATEVFLSENGAGSLNISNSTSSPFSFTYSPASGDIGNVVTITVTTNNPLGSPCQAVTQTYLIQVLQLPNGQISGNNIICNGQSTTLTASGGSSYSWSNGLGTNASQTVSPTATTTYTVTVTGSNTCTSTATRTVTVNASPTPSITSSNLPLCVGQTRNLTATPAGGTFFVFSGPGAITGSTLSSSSGGTIVINYSYTDGNGCTAIANQSINSVAIPTMPVLTSNCTGTSLSTITVTSPTGAGLEYRLNGGSWQSSNVFTNVANGSNQIVDVRNSTGCINTNLISTSCGCFSQPTLSISPGSGAVCGLTGQPINGTRGGSATSVSFSHNGGAGPISSTTNQNWSITYTPVSSDLGKIITITATTNNPDGSPCNAATATYQLTVNALPNGQISGNNIICNGQSTTFTASGGATYQWSNGLGTNQTVPVSIAQTYTVTVTAANTCTNTATRTLTVNALPTPSITSSSGNLCVNSNRVLTASPSGGTFSMVSGNGNIIGNTLTATGSGTITVQYTYTDGNGCTGSTTQNITAIANPSLPTISSTCTGTNLSSITITPPGSGGPFTYSVNGSAFTGTTIYNNLPNGSHTVVIQNSNNCQSATVVNTNCGCFINPSITLSANTGSTCGTNPITVSGNTFTGATQVTVSPSTGFASSVFNNSPFTFTYTPTLSDIGTTKTFTFTTNNPDGAPCQVATAVYSLTINPVPFASISGNTSICTGQSTILTASGGTSYNWSGGLGSGASKTVSMGGPYTVTVTASNTCTSLASVTVNENPIPTINITSATTAICEGDFRTLTATPTGGNWTLLSAPSGTILFNGDLIVAGNTAGNASVRYSYTSPQNCSNTNTFNIPIALYPITPTASVTCTGDGVGTVTITSPLTAGNQYSVDGGATWQSSNVFPNQTNGTKLIVVKNSAGCTQAGFANVACQTCGCTTTLQASGTCNINLTNTCPGYNFQYQESLNGSSGWINVGTQNVNIYVTRPNRYYRVRFWSSLCADFFSNVLHANINYSAVATAYNTTSSGEHITNGSWGISGTKFFNDPPVPLIDSETPDLIKNSGPNNGWYPSQVIDTRMNLTAVRTVNNTNIVTYTATGAAQSIGFAADDVGQICINGVEIYNLTNTVPNTNQNFNWWYVININIPSGASIVIKYSDVNGTIDGFGFELYNTIYQNMINATTIQISSNYRVMSSRTANSTYYLCPSSTKPDPNVTVCNPVPLCVCEN